MEHGTKNAAWLRAGIGAAAIVGGLMCFGQATAEASPKLAAVGEGEEDAVIGMSSSTSSTSAKECKCPVSSPVFNACDGLSKLSCSSSHCTDNPTGKEERTHTCSWS